MAGGGGAGYASKGTSKASKAAAPESLGASLGKAIAPLSSATTSKQPVSNPPPSVTTSKQPAAGKSQQLANLAPSAIDLHRSSYEELQVARIYTRQRQDICIAHGYNSEDDASDNDEEDGKLYTQCSHHDNGQKKFQRTFTVLQPKNPWDDGIERIVEEKHYSPEGVCMLDVHFGLGQPYLSRKHYHHNQRLKSEKLFFVDDDRTMSCRKSGWWRTYYETGSIESEMQYDHNGVRVGFCKRYGEDGTLLWCKDYTKDYIQRARDVNSKVGEMEFSVEDASKLLGFPEGRLPKSAHEVNREYRRQCALLHPDKSDDPNAAERFMEASRARDLLLTLFPGSTADDLPAEGGRKVVAGVSRRGTEDEIGE